MLEIERLHSFEFYGLGQLDTSQESIQSLVPNCHWVRFEVHGSEAVRSLLITVDEDLEANLALELGNTLAAKAAGSLSRKEGWDVMISPPRYSAGVSPLTLSAVDNSIKSGESALHSFRFIMKEHIFTVQLIFLAPAASQ